MNKFRPSSSMTKKSVMRQRLKYGYADNYNWQTRVKWHPAGWGFNKKVIGDMHSKLHYLACHAPKPIQKRWSNVYKVFYKKHFGAKHASMRYLNNYSCHAWL